MTRNRFLRGRPVSVLLGSLIALVVLSGCVASDDETGLGPADDNGEMTETNGEGDTPATEQNGDDANGMDEPECTPTTSGLFTFSHDGLATPDPAGADPAGDPFLLLGESGIDEFTVAEGTTSLIITAIVGDFVTLGFQVALHDPTDTERFSFDGAAGIALGEVTGEEPLTSDATITGPAPGTWSAVWSVTGYVEGLSVSVDAERCV